MRFLARVGVIMASVAAFILTILEIMQDHLGVDTEAMLKNMGGESAAFF